MACFDASFGEVWNWSKKQEAKEEEEEKLSLNFEVEKKRSSFSKAGKVLLQFHFIQDV